jgi:hypothetical protein
MLIDVMDFKINGVSIMDDKIVEDYIAVFWGSNAIIFLGNI